MFISLLKEGSLQNKCDMASLTFNHLFRKRWTLDYIDPDLTSSGLKMEIVFKRRITNELMTTYFPSCLLLLISYATTFFKPFYFEAQVTVNLSVMLVTTNLFIRCLLHTEQWFPFFPSKVAVIPYCEDSLWKKKQGNHSLLYKQTV